MAELADDSEVSFIGYGQEDKTIVTMGWDRKIKVHADDRKMIPEDNVYRRRGNCHGKNGHIISGDYAHNLQMIATGSRDYNVRIWDYEKFKPLFELRAHEEEVTMVKFLKPLPLLLTADSKGMLFVWLIPGPWV
jgi:WD40 repeat protein